MKTGVRTYETAELRISVPTAVPNHVRPHLRELSHLHVPEVDRKRGYASALLAQTIHEADKHGMGLMLTVMPYDGSLQDVVALTDFYKKFGFETIQHEPSILMLRPAGCLH